MASRLDVTVYVNVARSEFATACPALIAWPPASVAGATAVEGVNPFFCADAGLANDKTANHSDSMTTVRDMVFTSVNSEMLLVTNSVARGANVITLKFPGRWFPQICSANCVPLVENRRYGISISSSLVARTVTSTRVWPRKAGAPLDES